LKTNKYSFLNLLKQPLDQAQNEALETTKNAVIAAGAGSGKTQVLATRFAWLVITGKAKSDEILTLTFTNKAAAEMYQRIYGSLKFFAEHEICDDLTENQRQLARNGLVDFSNAHIQTLDSYCANIVRQCSNRYGIRPDFSTGSSDGIRDVKNRALQFTLKNATVPGIAVFAEAGQLQNFAEKTIAHAINEYTDLTTPDDYFSSMLPHQTKLICEALNFYFSTTQRNNNDFPFHLNLCKMREDVISIFKNDNKPKDHLAYKTAVEEALLLADPLLGYNFSENAVLSQNNNLKQFISDYEKFKKEIKATTALKGKYTPANTAVISIRDQMLPVIDSLLSYINQYPALQSLYSLLDTFLVEVKTAKRESGNLSFADVSALALQILIENEDIREQEISSYKKIMTDEFQDNNGKNRDLLYLLSLKPGTKITTPDNQNTLTSIHNQIIIKDPAGTIVEDKRSPEKLFFVGDEKQSIYKFRGAEVSVFNELTQANENKLVQMTYNYRSDDNTVQAFNVLFQNGKGIFANSENRIDYEAYYDKEALKNGHTLPELTKDNVPFHVRFVNTNKLSDQNSSIVESGSKLLPPEDQIAYDIANIIYKMGSEKKNWNSFAILAKSRTHQNIITKYLSLRNIPYEVDAFKNIFEDGVINDIYNFLRLCVYPSDINAYSAYLCSPFSGLSVNSLEIILSHLVNIDDNDFVFNPFISENDDIKNELSEKEYKKYLKAKNFLQEQRSEVLQQRITKTLDLLWNKTGYKYETLLNSQTELAAEHFDMIFELARSCEEQDKTVSWFIDELETLKKSMSSEDSDIDAANITYPLERKESVKIMTIHKSKGLQFEHVFLCDCTDVRVKSENSNVFFDEKNGLSIKPEKGTGNYFCICQKELEKKKELAEFRRLIYVGITRAIKDVYITGKWAPNGESYDTKTDFHILERLVEKAYTLNSDETVTFKEGQAFDFTNIPLVTYNQSSSNSDNLTIDELRKKKIQKLSDKYANCKELTYESNAIPRLSPSDLEQELQKQTYTNGKKNTPGFTAADFGTLVHAFLEAQAKGLSPSAFQPPMKLLKNLDKEGQTSVINQCIEYCNLFNQTEKGLSLLSARTNNRFFRAEWEFKMFWKNTIWTGSIDLIYKNEDGSYTIIDYKSDTTIDKEKYEGQQNCYKTAAAKLLKTDETNISCYLWFMKENKFIEI